MANPFGRLSIRKFLTFVAAMLVTIFAYLLLTSPTAHAVDATWNQGSIVFNGNTYRGPIKPTPDQNLPADSIVYTYVNPQSDKIDVLYFPPGTDTTTASNATRVSYDMGPTGGVSNKSSTSTVTIDRSTADEADKPANPSSSSCKLDAIGWIICPVTNFLATGMDWVFDIISGYLKTRPLDTVTSSSMFKAWEVMRNFANAAFVIAFLVLIYSQLTSFGLSNYGVKKMIPRLIIAAILVNASYWICAVAIDISNILGFSLQGIFIGLRNTIMGNNANSWDLVSWESITSFILSGGAIAGAGIAGAVALTTTLAGSFAVGGVALILVPILLGAFLTVLVVLFILAARQALITLLVIIAPLAFVAYIMPNTEKWFEKWRGLFMTMLIMFPAFSVIFGGAQLAGILIIQNASDINVVLLGMAVQIAPLAITPLLFKLSGNLLSRVAGIINNPSKGVLDRTKNWSKDRLDARRADQMRKNRALEANGQIGKARYLGRRTALRFDTQKRLREGQKSYDESDATSMFLETTAGHRLHRAQFVSNNLKEGAETRANTVIKRDLNTEGSDLHVRNVELEYAKSQLKNQDEITADQMAKYRTEEYLNNHANPLFSDRTRSAIRGLADTEKQIALHGLATQSAKRVADNEFGEYMQANKDAQRAAGSIEGITGAQRALASAMKTQQTAHQEAVANAGVIIDHGNYNDSVITDLALNNSGTTGITVTEDIREAAIKRIAGGKNATELVRLFKEVDIAGLPQDLRQELGDSVLANPARPKWMGAGTIAKIKQGDITTTGDARIQTWIAETVNADKLSSIETLIGQDPDYLAEVVKALSNASIVKDMGTEKLAAIKQQIHMGLHDNRYNGRIGERENTFRGIYDRLPATEGAPATYDDAKRVPPPKPRRA